MENINTRIRAYMASDNEKLSTIWLDASLSAHAFIGEERLREQQRLIETTYLPDSETWVACQSGEPIGFISLVDSFIGGLFVAPHYQMQGIGRILVGHAMALKEELRLEVYVDNHRALAFYQTLGFEELSRRAIDDDGLPFETVQLRLKS
ncbi:GNAT family N-acetyltransferase [Epibacterium sp. SM1979]|uniref:GNAT family N-acetyltransferase n=1 Tax=Tritonibacter litoralis TaxID=2662264 RepID=A0A843YM20_9RHOB|nr:GNAT family N-acetyltransferase [Tritonibacter litoralis]MQQ10464.1 GNAT family N-acetyltransferase [Tritonibacter litoralis]